MLVYSDFFVLENTENSNSKFCVTDGIQNLDIFDKIK